MPRQSSFTRRRFLQQSAFASATLTLLRISFAHSSSPAPIAAVRTRAPLFPGIFTPLPLGSIRPAGWLRAQLQIQAHGLSGHLDETWPDVGPNSGWLGGTGESWERGPYFLDGLIPLAYLLDDAHLKAKAQRYVDWTLTHQRPNGMIGPASNDDWWPRIVMLKALTQYHEATADPRVLPLMDRYFRLQLSALPARPLRDWGKFRWQDNLLSVLWLYNRTGDAYLLDLARLLHRQGHDWIAQYSNFQFTQPITAEFIKLNEDGGLKDLALSTHGVNNGQALKTGPAWSIVSGSQSDRDAVLQMLAELDRWHGLPNGMFSCDEHLAGRDPSHGSELCTVVESMFSLEQALAITGRAALGDRLEKLAFNALPGTFTDDMWAHQYNQEPNQVECSLHHKPWVSDGPESNLYGLEPNFGCCTANFSQGWPKFTAGLFMLSGSSDSDAGLAAVAYAPCELRTVLRGVPVHILEETDYPFRGIIRFTINPASPIEFPLSLRIPAWAADLDHLTVNEKENWISSVRGAMDVIQPTPPRDFTPIVRTWHAGDRVELTLPMQPRVTRWFNDSVAIERGPLVFSYGIGEDWVKLRDRDLTADWQVFPTTPWNYALALDAASPASGIKLSESEPGDAPFSRKYAPVTLFVKARKLPAWRADDGAANPLPQSPVATDQPEETLNLIPYAAAKLRITAFPQLKS
ncbi:MAG TPA: beta-L-arabinofuranosidase domain-containing protein [Terracidiphilus sp.]|nr:beta-L-arabinofuranosidase domain-containing protein [Terracidiphilus sp.]